MRENLKMSHKFLLFVSFILLVPSSVLAMDEWEMQKQRHTPINLQETNMLSKEQLQDLYRTGHLLSEEGWYHVGDYDSYDVWAPYYNEDMETLRFILECMEHPQSSAVGVGKKFLENHEIICNSRPKAIFFYYKIIYKGQDLNEQCIVINKGTDHSTYRLALALQGNRQANRKKCYAERMN